jgi:hypothetical protein
MVLLSMVRAVARRRVARSLLAVAVGVAGLAGVGVTAMAGPAMAASHAVYQETRGIDKTYEGQHSGDWQHCVYITKENYTQYPNCSVGVTVTTDVSGNAGFTYDSISAGVGFDVSYSTTITGGNGVVVKKGGSGWFDAGFRYNQYKIGMERRTCVSPGPCGSWSKPYWVTVQQHLGNTFAYFGTGAE